MDGAITLIGWAYLRPAKVKNRFITFYRPHHPKHLLSGEKHRQRMILSYTKNNVPELQKIHSWGSYLINNQWWCSRTRESISSFSKDKPHQSLKMEKIKTKHSDGLNLLISRTVVQHMIKCPLILVHSTLCPF